MRLFILVGMLSVVLFSCTSKGKDKQLLRNEISKLESIDDSMIALNSVYLAYAESFPEDSLTPSYLLSLAKNYLSSTPKRDSAAFYAQKIFNDYPSSSEAAEAMFFFASLQPTLAEKAHWYQQTYENYKGSKKGGDALIALAVEYENAGDKDKALNNYEAYIASYPNGTHVKDAQLSIKNINVPLEELIKQFEKQN
jgi:TolA-binding protein